MVKIQRVAKRDPRDVDRDVAFEIYLRDIAAQLCKARGMSSPDLKDIADVNSRILAVAPGLGVAAPEYLRKANEILNGLARMLAPQLPVAELGLLDGCQRYLKQQNTDKPGQ